MSDRVAEVLAASHYINGPHTPTILARCLNLYRDQPCNWCPVLPPKPGATVATVTKSSADRVRRVLAAMEKTGQARRANVFGRRIWTITVRL